MIGIVAAVLVCAPMTSAAWRVHRGPVMLRPKWRPVALPSTCSATLIHPPWVLCGTDVLYNINTQQSQPIQAPGDPGLQPVAIGSRWVEFAGEDCSADPLQLHPSCAVVLRFVNVATGDARDLPQYQPGGTIAPNLDSPNLAASLCSPLRVGRTAMGNSYDPPAPGFVIMTAGFAVIEQQSPDTGQGPFDPDYLEQCRTGRRIHIGDWLNLPGEPGLIDLDQQAVVGTPGGRGVGGLYLPSLHRFVITEPAGSVTVRLALSGRSVYALQRDGKLLVAPLAADQQPDPRR